MNRDFDIADDFPGDDYDELDAFDEELLGDEAWEQSAILLIDDGLQARLAGTEWEERVAKLNEDTPFAERVKLYQAIRDAQVLPEEAGYFLIAWAIGMVADQRIRALVDSVYEPRFAKIREAHGIDEEDEEAWDSGFVPAPPEYLALTEELDNAIKAIHLSTYQSFGEHRLGQYLEEHLEEAERKYEEGHTYLLDFDTPQYEASDSDA